MHRKLLYVKTIGCQMNVYDSKRFGEAMRSSGYESADSPEAADLILLNTCSIREKAEQKAFSFLGRVAKLKRRNKNLITGVCGCVAQQEGEKILSRMPHVDLVLGTRAIGRLSDNIARIEKEGGRIVDTDFSIETPISSTPRDCASPAVSEFVTIMRGCDNFCTYCVVPHVRGRETSRNPDGIVGEIESLVENGVKEVTLLGQNVNSYGKKEGLCDFPELLYRVSEIRKLERIRFTTSHPKDISDGLIRAYAGIDKLCGHIHLPVQSGSDDVLKRMNRRYAVADYLEKIDRLRSARPGIAVTSDFIAGFPGETSRDFEMTLDLMRKVEFDGSFAFIYSARPHTAASKFEDTVPEPEKKSRLQRILKLQERFTEKSNESLVGKEVEVLVEAADESKKFSCGNTPRWTGRTGTNKIVNFTDDSGNADHGENLAGKTVTVKIERALAHSLTGIARRC